MADVSYININGTQYTIDDLQATQELADVRVGADGQTYASAGEAVRAQIEAVNESMTAAQGDITAIYDEIDTVKGDVSTAQGDITTLQGDVSDLQTDVSAIEGNIASEFSTSTTYAIGDYCVYNGSLYKAIAAHTGAWSAADFEEVTVAGEIKEIADNLEAVDETLENKANIDGSYETMTVGNAEQLVATVGVDDSTPYNFRTSGGSVDIGDRETVNAVVGGTVAWNQLCDISNGTQAGGGNQTSTKTADFSLNKCYLFSLKATFQSRPTSEGGSGFASTPVVIGFWKGGIYRRLAFYYRENGNYASVVRGSDLSGTMTSQASANILLQLFPNSGETVTYSNINVIDLTQMFGSTIADYIYGLEQDNAGAGVAWFRKLFPKPYYAYDAGSLQSVNTSAHNMVGFNAWDEEWEVGTINAQGELIGDLNNIRSKNYIPVVPSTTYYAKCSSSLLAYYYDADKVFISGSVDVRNLTFITPSNCHYVKIRTGGYGSTYHNDICINLSWDGERDGEYEPYKKWSYPLDSSLTLRGIPKLDASNNLYYDGDSYEADGTVTRRYEIVDLGTLNWKASSTDNCFYSNAFEPSKFYATGNSVGMICPKYKLDGARDSAPYFGDDKTLCYFRRGSDGVTVSEIYIHDDDYSDIASFKAAMSGVYLVYELATPTTESATPYTQIQTVDDFGTEEYTDFAYENGDRDVAIPVGHNTVYSQNLRAKLEMSPNSPDGDGLYVVEQSNGQNEYVPLVIPTELPTAPSEDGTYTLKITVSGGTVTKSWIAEE